jgi:hypothetical protein
MVPYTMAQLVTYDGVTRALAAHLAASPDSSAEPRFGEWSTIIVALAGASAAALVASLASQPGDTLLSKLNQGRRAAHAHAGHAAQRARRSKPGLAAGTDATGVPCVTSSDDELEMGALGATGTPLASSAAASAAAAAAAETDAPLPLSAPCDDGGMSPRGGSGSGGAASGFGCAPMCALAGRLGPAGLMLGWDARLAHTGTIVLVQLLIYDAVKAAVGLPVSAHGGAAAATTTEEIARRLALM